MNDKLLNYLIATDSLDEFLGKEELKEQDKIRTKDGRIGIVVTIIIEDNLLEIIFDDIPFKTETISLNDVDVIIKTSD